MKVNWTDAARIQLRDIHTFLSRSPPQYATKMVDRLTRRSQQIATFPRSGRVVPEANDVNIREILRVRIALSITCSATR
ncbi:MAG TPA: type II toxin-antitoxin system RelE/ParE family toxin [Blastocatellia bacterium]|nr:type II toxin-antitoxin system RelE/ParE family toxin [Blastocatellia bacterium]